MDNSVLDISGIRNGDIRAVSGALSLVESGSPGQILELLQSLHPFSGKSRVLGVTGSPGAGKSTLVEQLARRYICSEKVGILAVDPTSPFSGGAFLGDRVRMQGLSTDPRIYIRSMATRGHVGGLAPSVIDALTVLSAAGYASLLVETVGAGQDEVDIIRAAGVTLVVLVPGMGDDIQAIKAGIMEIGDIFVINKSDREGVEQTRREIEALLSLADVTAGWTPPIVETVATTGEGIDELVSAIDDCRSYFLSIGEARKREFSAHREWLERRLSEEIMDRFWRQLEPAHLQETVRRLVDRRVDPLTAVRSLLERGLSKPLVGTSKLELENEKQT
jgi:LAO/AO transport system kinase